MAHTKTAPEPKGAIEKVTDLRENAKSLRRAEVGRQSA
jgi:hypothetical protein